MKVPARLTFITLADERSEQTEIGQAEIDGDTVRLSYQSDTYALCLTTDGKTATVERRGEHGYSLTLDETRETMLTVDGLQAPVRTQKLRLHQSENAITFMAKYCLGDNDVYPMQVIAKACF